LGGIPYLGIRIEGLDQMAHLLYAKIEDMFKPARHTLVIGQPRCLPIDTKIVWRNSKASSPQRCSLEDILDQRGFVESYDFNRGTNTITEANVKLSGRKRVHKIVLESGRTVKASPDHLFFAQTNDGRIRERRLLELRIGDRLVLKKNAEGIVSIGEGSEEETADLTVPETNNFFLENGILTHNSGKTSFLLKITAKFFQLGEYVIIRDIGEFFEFFNLIDELRLSAIGFVPEGCHVRFNHPSYEEREFDITDLDSLFGQFERDKLNMIMVEGFTDSMRDTVAFWRSFFSRILPWKRRPGNGAKRFCLVLDEFGDVAPGQGRYFIPDQAKTTQLIAVNYRKFRRHHIRMVAAVHYFRDITPPLRERFDCYVVKKNYPNPKEVPFVLRNYAKRFPTLKLDQAIYVDSTMNFNQLHVKELIKPLRYDGVEKSYIEVEGTVETSDDETQDEVSQSSKLYKLVDHLMEKRILTSKQIGQVLGVSASTVRDYRMNVHNISEA
jgi:hypothetical protein